jgi:mono/diheme cytochrome c family protein
MKEDAMKNAATIVIAVALALTLAACGSARRSLPLVGPLQLSEKAAAGELHYERYCHQCHPHGEGGLGPAINNKPLPSFLIKFQVREGLGAMPAFPRSVISDRQLDEIVDYLKALRRAG